MRALVQQCLVLCALSLPIVLGQAALAAPDPRVEILLADMTLEEKAGQLGVFARPGGSDFNPGSDANWNATCDLIRNGSIGALYNGAGVVPNLALQKIAVEESRLGIPLIFAADVWHGMRTIFPIPLGEAASWEPALAEHHGLSAPSHGPLVEGCS